MGKKFKGSGNVDGFPMLNEGKYAFKVLSAKYNEAKDNVELDIVTQDGEKHKEYYNLVKQSGEVNTFAVDSVIRLCSACLNNESLKQQELDIDWLPMIVGKFFVDEIQHNEYNGKTSAHLNPYKYESASGFDAVSQSDEDDLDNI